MSRALKLVFLCILATVVQTELVKYIKIFSVAPDFLIIMLALLTDDYGTFGGFCAGALIALLYDSTTGYAPAINLVMYTVIGFAAGFMRGNLDVLFKRFKHKSILELWLIVFILTFVREIVYIGYLFLIGAEQSYVTIFRMLVCCIYTSVLVIPLALYRDFRKRQRIRARLQKQEEAEIRSQQKQQKQQKKQAEQEKKKNKKSLKTRGGPQVRKTLYPDSQPTDEEFY